MGYGPFQDLSNASFMATDTPLFHKEKHVSYWLRCLRSPLPHQYTSNDSNRMSLAFFTISALDLLGCLFTRTTPAEREEYASWVYRCQHPDGGFRGFPGTDFGDRSNADNAVWDPANVPATYFALAILCVIGDDLGRVKRRECLQWLARMQRPDGSFGELLGEDGSIRGGSDTRYGYCAMVARWILRGNLSGVYDGVPDIRVDDLVACINGSETYDGGMADEPFHEAHAGFTYCAIGALAMIDRLPAEVRRRSSTSKDQQRNGTITGIYSLEATVRWLISRMTTTIDEEDYDMNFDEEAGSSDNNSSANELEPPFSNPGTASSSSTPESSFVKLRSIPASPSGRLDPPQLLLPAVEYPFDPVHTQWAAFNGRANKIADTCYVFWAGAALTILNKAHLINSVPVRRYLCEKTQHIIAGGFGKLPGDPPDIYHAYMGLAALAILDIGKSGDEVVLAKAPRNPPSASVKAPHSSDPKHPSSADPEVEETEAGGDGGGGEEAKEEDGEWSCASGAHLWSDRGQDVKIQIVEDLEREDGGEGGEVGNGGGVLRSLDPALCISMRARRWIEDLPWRKEALGGRPDL